MVYYNNNMVNCCTKLLYYSTLYTYDNAVKSMFDTEYFLMMMKHLPPHG